MHERDASPKRQRSFESEFLRPACHKAGQQLLLYFGTLLECDTPILEALFYLTSMAFLTCGPNYSNSALLNAAVERMAVLYPRLERDAYTFKNAQTNRTISIVVDDSGIMFLLDNAVRTRIHPTNGGPFFGINRTRPGQFQPMLDDILFALSMHSEWKLSE